MARLRFTSVNRRSNCANLAFRLLPPEPQGGGGAIFTWIYLDLLGFAWIRRPGCPRRRVVLMTLFHRSTLFHFPGSFSLNCRPGCHSRPPSLRDGAAGKPPPTGHFGLQHLAFSLRPPWGFLPATPLHTLMDNGLQKSDPLQTRYKPATNPLRCRYNAGTMAAKRQQAQTADSGARTFLSAAIGESARAAGLASRHASGNRRRSRL